MALAYTCAVLQGGAIKRMRQQKSISRLTETGRLMAATQ